MDTVDRIPVSRVDLVDAARDLAPLIAAEADQIEQERRLTQPVVDGLVEAGLYRMLVPSSLGGGETDPLTFATVMEAIAKADASTAWCLGQAAGSSLIAGFMDTRAAREVFGDRRAVLAWGPGSGTAVAVERGFRLNGRWSFASGCRQATWIGCQAPLLDEGGAPRLREDGTPQTARLLARASEVEIRDTWHTNGLRGTASDTILASDVFVPDDRAIRSDVAGRQSQSMRRESGKLWAFSTVYPIGFASVALGIARVMIDSFIDLASDKTPRGAKMVLRNNARVQWELATWEGEWRSARAFLHESVQKAWESAGPAGAVPLENRILVRLAATHAIHAAARVAGAAYQAAGATAIFIGSAFERRFRDINALTQQLQGSQMHFETVGQYFLGLDPDRGWL